MRGRRARSAESRLARAEDPGKPRNCSRRAAQADGPCWRRARACRRGSDRGRRRRRERGRSEIGCVVYAGPELGSLSALGTSAAPASGPLGPEDVPIPNAPPLAGTESIASGNTVDGIECSAGEQTLFHIHAHLTLFVNGSARQVPYGIGIPGAQAENTPRGACGPGSCFYWLHTHAANGIIHIESPVQRTFTLGDFFDIWGQKLSATSSALRLADDCALQRQALRGQSKRHPPERPRADPTRGR